MHEDGAPHDAPPDAPPKTIEYRDGMSVAIPSSNQTTMVTIPTPGAHPGDVMLAIVAMGATGQALPPMFTAPSGWTLIRQVDEANNSGLALYWHAVGPTIEPANYTWTLNEPMEGIAWISVYRNVLASAPIDVEAGVLDSTMGTSYTTPALVTTDPNTLLVATFASHQSNSNNPPTWSAPAGATVRWNVNDGTTRSGVSFDEAFAGPGMTPALTATVSAQQNYALIDVLALTPAP